MIALLFKKLEQYGKLSEKSKDLLSEHMLIKRYKAGEAFLEIGEFSKEVGFTLSGVFRSYIYQKVEVKTTADFIGTNEFLSNFKSFYENLKSDHAIECEIAGDVAVVTLDAWRLFEKEIPEWRNMINYNHNCYLLTVHNFQREILNKGALNGYQYFCEKFPNIAHNVALGHIASYLGITQSTLSRIRRKDLQLHFFAFSQMILVLFDGISPLFLNNLI